MRMHICSNYLRRLGWVWLVPGLIMVAALVSLAIWQLHRAQEKEQMLEHIAQLQAKGADNAAGLEDLGPERADGLPVKFNGRWQAPIVWLLDNQIVEGQVGYDVVIPVQIPGRNNYVLVNLGWLPAPEARERLPRVEIPDLVAVNGIYRAHTSGLLLGENLEDKGVWPMRLQQIRSKSLAGYLSHPLFPGAIYQQQASPFKVHYYPVVLPPERHRAYALQWALLALALFIVLVAVNLQERDRHG